MKVVPDAAALGVEAYAASVEDIEQAVVGQTCLVAACLVLQAETVGYLDS